LIDSNCHIAAAGAAVSAEAVLAALTLGSTSSPALTRRGAKKLHPHPPDLPEAELDQAALNTFAENPRLYSPAMDRLTPLPIVETGLLSFSNCPFRAIRRIPPAYCRRRASVHPIKENLLRWSFCVLQG
jgi:hypothetical protein